MNNTYTNLFDSLTFKNGVILKNRVVMAPMTTWSSNDDYTISDEEVSYYKKRVNGVGLVITGCTHVQENGIGFTHEFAAYDDSFTDSLRKLADAAKSGGAPAILQIFHAGNKALPSLIPSGEAVSASAVETEASAFAPALLPKELTHEDILEVIHAFGETTKRAIQVGFDGVELHGAHGFLLQNFVSPYFNRREDEWGGSLEARLRFPMAVIQEIKNTISKEATKPFILGYRISPEEPQEGGLRLKDTYALINKLIEADVDYVHASLDQALTAKPTQGDQTYLELILAHVNNRVPVMAAGSLSHPADASLAIEKGTTLVAIGHALVTDSQWVEKVQSGKEAEISNVIKKSEVGELELPEKLWNIIQASGPWFNVVD